MTWQADLAAGACHVATGVAILRFVAIKRDVAFRYIYFWFSAALSACGAAELAAAAGGGGGVGEAVRWANAVSAAATAALYWRLVPRMAAMRDQSELEEANRLLTEQGDAIRQLNQAMQLRIQTLEAFHNSVCHDLHAPLRSIEGFSQALLEDSEAAASERLRDYCRRIRTAAERMRSLMRDLLRLSSLTATELRVVMEDFSLSDLAEEVVREERAYPENLPHRVRVEPGMTAHGDRNLVKILLQNVVANAFKFSGRRRWPEISVGRAGGEFFVRDNGIGFGPKDAERIFEPFVRLVPHLNYPGTGIGLTVARRVAEVHGGHLRAEAEPDAGATFYFTLGRET